jgi:hypothetical protein
VTTVQDCIRVAIFEDICGERDRQDAKFGWADDGTSLLPGRNLHAKVSVLLEEVGEVAKAVLERDAGNLTEELVQVAACAVAWLEAEKQQAAGLL